LERNGFAPESVRALKEAYRILYRSNLNTKQALAELRATLEGSAEVQQLIEFIESSERGIIR
jgi:UDP-N-acetylglucosamine acyltransferase